MQINASVTTENGFTIRRDECPEGYSEVRECTPLTGPWEHYGNKWATEQARVLNAAGIPTILLYTHRTINNPIGSGPGGRVRFGDNMVPGTYRIAVENHNVAGAAVALVEHDEHVRKWLHENGPIPEACRV